MPDPTLKIDVGLPRARESRRSKYGVVKIKGPGRFNRNLQRSVIDIFIIKTDEFFNEFSLQTSYLRVCLSAEISVLHF